MSEATVIYPHQLFKESPAVTAGRPVYLVEESLLLTHNPIHRQKLVLHKLSMDAYQVELEAIGQSVTRITIGKHPTTNSVFGRLRKDGVTDIHVVDTTDYYLEQALLKSQLDRVWYDSPLFILQKDEAIERFTSSKKFMASFYKQLRKDKNILLESDGTPAGGKWSFDEDNRRKLPKDIELPPDLALYSNEDIQTAEVWAKKVDADKYGECGCWVPYTRAEAEKFLQEFLRLRFTNFGTYEDAMTTKGARLFHSTLSPLINIGLITPHHVLDTALAYAKENNVPLNSLEGFVRQILGWREFIRASYECDGRTMRQQNFFNHTRSLPDSYWTGSTGIEPVDHAIKTAQTYAYTHHIERLMVMGNVMLLSQIHPTDVYRWFMGMYIDAYDWVMVPNVYGMSQFADGGSFATKPYISGSNYIKKMSDYQKGEGDSSWEAIWTALYWNFIATHKDFFISNYRLSMMPRLLEKMDPLIRERHLTIAKKFLQSDKKTLT